FAQLRRDRFDSELSPLLTTSTESMREGVQAEIALDKQWTLSPEASFEKVERDLGDETHASFQRASGKMQVNLAMNDLPGAELLAHLRLEGAFEHAKGDAVW